jgi:F1F0 ATPase subunit 2
VAGLALGALYFTGLWQTVKRMPTSERPLRLMLGSFALRLIVLLTAFFFIMGGHWERLAAAMIGFVTIKIFLTRKLGIKKAA